MTNRRMVLLYLAGVFLAGGLAGGFGGYALGRRPIFRPPNPQSMTEHLVGQLTRDLSLTEDQVAKVRPIVEAATAEADKVHAGTWERIRGVMTDMNRRIEPLLNPDQRQKLAEKERQRSDRLRKKGPRSKQQSGPPPQTPPH